MRLNPYLEVILASIIWGSAGVFAKILDLPATSLSFIRSFIPALFLCLYFAVINKNVFRKGAGPILFTSFLSSFRLLFYFAAINLTAVSNVIIISYTYPIFTAFFSFLYLKERITIGKIFLLLLGFSGIVMMYGPSSFSFSSSDFWGMTATLGSTIIFVINALITKKEIHKFSRLEIVFYQNLIPAFMFLPFIFINRPMPGLTQWTIGTIYALLVGVVGFYLFFSALRKIDLTIASIIGYIEVVSGVLLAVIFLDEQVTMNMIIGGGLILTSTLLLQRYAKDVSDLKGE